MYSQQRQKEKARWIYPVRLAMEASWYQDNGHHVYWDKETPIFEGTKVVTEPEGLPFLSLPKPLRWMTRAFDPKYQNNGNFKYKPGTYIQSASGCSHGKCTFCVENGKPYEVRPVEAVIEEIAECKAMGFKEVFDDSATFPGGAWLVDFCDSVRKYNIKFSCNMRLDCDPFFYLMYKSGFRMVLFGIESANQKTLDKINKGVKVENIIPTIKKAAQAGLDVHTTTMFGYPWETDDDAQRTLELVHFLLRRGYAKTAQASLYMPPDGRCREEHRKYIPQIYKAAYSLEFWFNKLKDIHDVDDIKYLWRQIKEGVKNV